MTGYNSLFDSTSNYTRLRLAWGDGRQQLLDHFQALREHRDDPELEALSSDLSALLPDRAPQTAPSPAAYAAVRGFEDLGPPSLYVRVREELRIGPGRNVPGNPTFSGQDPNEEFLADDCFCVAAGDLTPDRPTLITILTPQTIRSLVERHGTNLIGSSTVSRQQLPELLIAAFNDSQLKNLDVARILSGPPTIEVETDDNGHLLFELPVPHHTPCLPEGTSILIHVG